MFRFKDRQLHIIVGLLFAISIVMFCVMALPYQEKLINGRTIDTMTDCMEGWICNYSTTDLETLQKNLTKEELEQGKHRVQEVKSLPFRVPVTQGKVLEMSNKIPVISGQFGYFVIETNYQSIAVYVGAERIYESKVAQDQMRAYHLIPIPAKYQENMVRIVVQSEKEEYIELEKIQFGSYFQIVGSALYENGMYFLIGILMIVLAISMFLLRCLLKSTKEKRKILDYVCLQSFGVGMLFVVQSRLFQVLTGWNYTLFLWRTCLVLIAPILHFILARCFLTRKKVCFLLDLGTIVYGIIFISVMVLQAFELVSFYHASMLGEYLFEVAMVICTLMFAVTVMVLEKKEGIPILLGNGIVTLGIILHYAAPLLGYGKAKNIYIPIAYYVYMLMMSIIGLRKACHTKDEVDGARMEERIRMQVVEQMNPNLLFAAFHTLQKMIKMGSENSTKMIYYISVYFRDNLRALDKAGEIVKFNQELEHIVAYLQLQKNRNHELNFAIECRAKEFLILRHSIEPIVENAVKHGIAGNNNKGNVVVRSYERQDGYAIQIIDDGIGFDRNILKKSGPTALLCLLEQLEEQCSAKTEIVSKIGKGTIITIVLPMLENELLLDGEIPGKKKKSARVKKQSLKH